MSYNVGWNRVANTKISSVYPSPVPPGSTGPSSVTKAWGGGAYDSVNHRMFIWGGGDQDYSGNEVYIYSVGGKNMTRRTDPTPAAQMLSYDEKYLDGRPCSRHTYNFLEFLPVQDRILAFGGVTSTATGSSTHGANDTWWWDYNLTGNAGWEEKIVDGASTEPQRYISAIVYDSVRNLVWMQQFGGDLHFYSYDPLSSPQAWVRRRSYGAGFNNYMSAVHDPVRQRMIILGGGLSTKWISTAVGSVYAINTATTSGETAIEATRSPGATWDPVSQRVVCWNGLNNVYFLDQDVTPWRWTVKAYTGGPPACNQSTYPQTFGRFRYSSLIDAFVSVNETTDDVFVLKTRANLQAQTWTSRALGTNATCPAVDGGAKHIRLAHNRDDGKIYVMGGDYQDNSEPITGDMARQDGRQTMYTYDIATNVWTRIQKYYREDSLVQAAHPDQVGWIWDEKRQWFWMVPGYQGQIYPLIENPPGNLFRTTGADPRIMYYVPGTGYWNIATQAVESDGTNLVRSGALFSLYDPVNDEIIRWYGMNEKSYGWMNITAGTWSRTTNYLAGGLWQSMPAFDRVNRRVYLICEMDLFLYRYNMADRTLTQLAALPGAVPQMSSNPVWEQMCAYDHYNEVLLYAHTTATDDTDLNQIRLYIYHPDSGVWETDAMTTYPAGQTVRGRHLVWDQFQNALMVFGPKATGNRPLFLYRYGPELYPAIGGNEPPAAPVGLRIVR